jgi:hypothetical protein
VTVSGETASRAIAGGELALEFLPLAVAAYTEWRGIRVVDEARNISGSAFNRPGVGYGAPPPPGGSSPPNGPRRSLPIINSEGDLNPHFTPIGPGNVLPGEALPDTEIIVVAGNATAPGTNILRPGIDDGPLGIVTNPGRSVTIATDLTVPTETRQMFGPNRGTRSGDILSGAFVGDVRSAGFDVRYAPTLSNPRHARIVETGTGGMFTNLDDRQLLSLAFDKYVKVNRSGSAVNVYQPSDLFRHR